MSQTPATVVWDGPTASIRRRWTVRGSSATLLAATEPEHFVELHPLITGVKVTERMPRQVDFEIEERVPVGPMRVPNRYRGRRTVVDEGHLVIEGWSAPAVYIRHELIARPRGGSLEVEHVVNVQAPWPVRQFVVNSAVSAHDSWVERVVAWMEAHPPVEA